MWSRSVRQCHTSNKLINNDINRYNNELRFLSLLTHRPLLQSCCRPSRQFNTSRSLRISKTGEVNNEWEPTPTTRGKKVRRIQSDAKILAATPAHHDLKSYITYANRNNVNQKSTVFRGTLYEYSVQHVLSDYLGFRGLMRSGKAGDKGVDLLGNWKKLLALIQCKSSTVKTGARLFREMAGVYNIFVAGSKDEGNAVIIIASPASITSQGMREFLQLSIPIIYCKIDYIIPDYNIDRGEYDYGSLTDGTALRSILYNEEAAKLLSRHGLEVNRKYYVDSATVVPSESTKASVKLSVSSTF